MAAQGDIHPGSSRLCARTGKSGGWDRGPRRNSHGREDPKHTTGQTANAALVVAMPARLCECVSPTTTSCGCSAFSDDSSLPGDDKGCRPGGASAHSAKAHVLAVGNARYARRPRDRARPDAHSEPSFSLPWRLQRPSFTQLDQSSPTFTKVGPVRLDAHGTSTV